MTTKALGPIIYRVGSGKEVALLGDLGDYCGGIVVSGHTGAYFRTSLASLIRSLDAPFFVDPSVWMLAGDSDRIRQEEGELRKSIDRYIDTLGRGVAKIVRTQGRSLKASDFITGDGWNDGLATELVSESIEAQRNFVDPSRQRTLDELLSLAEGGPLATKSYLPSFLVAPYFFGENTSSPWYRITVELLARSLAVKGSDQLFGVICVPKDILSSSDEREKIVADYSKADGVLVWISEFRDSGKESEASVRGFVDLVRALTKSGKPCYVLYGGFPTLLLLKCGLRGICHGLCYGDSKSYGQPPSLGPPPLRFYIPFAKTKLQLIQARAMYAGRPRRPCNCRECRNVGSSKAKWTQVEVNSFFGKLRNDETLPKKHFAACRWDEAMAVRQRSLTALMEDWNDQWKGNDALDPESFGLSRAPLILWSKLLAEVPLT